MGVETPADTIGISVMGVSTESEEEDREVIGRISDSP